MNALKHMEIIFGAVLALACIVAVLPDHAGKAAAAKPTAAARAAMPVVVIKAKRMTEVEKLQSLEGEPGGHGAAARS